MGNNSKPNRKTMSLPTMGEDVTGTVFVGDEEAPIIDTGTGSRTTLQANEAKVQEELSDLTMRMFELDEERDSLWAVYYGTQNKVQELQQTLEERQAQLNDAQIADVRYQLEQAQSQLREDLENAQNAQREYDEANRRIHTLETGFDTGDNSNWMDEIESGDMEEHGL